MPVGGMMAMGGVSAVAGIAGSKSSKKIQKEANAIAREGLEFNKERYYSYKKLYGGLEKQLVADAKEGVKADLAGVTNRAAADVTQQFAGAEETRLRNDQRLGINPNSGRAEAGARRLGMGKAAAEAFSVTNGRETERRNADEKTWQRRATVTGLGISQMTGAASGVNAANNNLQQSYQNSANAQQAQANQLYGTAGQLAGMGLGMATSPVGTAGTPGATTPMNLNMDGMKLMDDTPPLTLSFGQ